MSVSQIRALGDRLRGKDPARSDDLELLQQLRSDYDVSLQAAESVLREKLGLKATSRLKTVQTIVEKLVREKTRLSSMQDIAGLRIVADVTLDEQDELAKRLQLAFPVAEINDRRAHPSYGYRAVHVVVQIEGCPVEIQVRTRLQDLWAQAMESLGDAWGRQIRYGLPPDGDQMPMFEDEETPITRGELVALMIRYSASIAYFEAKHATPEEGKEMSSTLEKLVRGFARLSS